MCADVVLQVAHQNNPASSRPRNELRAFHASTGIVSRAAGSALVELGAQTKVIAAVYGPRQLQASAVSAHTITQAKVSCDFRYAPFSRHVQLYDPKGKKRTDEEVHLSKQLEDAISVSIIRESYPKSSIDVFVLVLDAAGGEFAAGICAASLALADAGLDLYDLVAASTLQITEDQVIVDPEQSDASPCMTLAYMASLQQVTHVHLYGSASDAELVNDAMETGVDAAAKIYKIMQNTLLNDVQKK
jgi:exosome complex component MTR3